MRDRVFTKAEVKIANRKLDDHDRALVGLFPHPSPCTCKECRKALNKALAKIEADKNKEGYAYCFQRHTHERLYVRYHEIGSAKFAERMAKKPPYGAPGRYIAVPADLANPQYDQHGMHADWNVIDTATNRIVTTIQHPSAKLKVRKLNGTFRPWGSR